MNKTISKADWEQFFPFKAPRNEQVEAIDFILNAFANGKTYVILDAATGIGKSSIGVTVSRYINANRKAFIKKFNTQGTWYLTTQKTLQAQYVNDFSTQPVNLKTIRSANNYQCQIFKQSSISMTCAEIQRLMNAHKFFQNVYKSCKCKCIYRDEKEKFIDATDSNTNYSYFLAESSYAHEIAPRDLLVLDEAHSVEDTLSSFIEITISEKFARQRLNVKTFPKTSTPMMEVFSWLQKKYHKSLSKRITHVKDMLSEGKTDEQIRSLTDFVKEYELLDKHICKLNRFIEKFDEKNWIMNFEFMTDKTSKKIVFKPIDVSCYAQEKLFDFGELVLMMSATIIDKDTFCQTLGLNVMDVAYKYMPSPFPQKNRPIHVLPVGSMSKAKIDATLPNMVEVVKEILDQHQTDKGIIHCHSYKIATYLQKNINSARLLLHDSNDREQTVEYHCNVQTPTVLLSPSMLEGINLNDDRSRFQIFCKIPYPYLGDEVIKKRMELYSGWYALQTLRSIIQGLGRSIRNEQDYAVTYILDADWDQFFKRNKTIIPSDVINCIQ